MSNRAISYLMVRLGAGISFFGHGLVRLPKLHEFSNRMTENFAHSMLPDFLVLPFSYALPVAEFVTGLLLVAGLFTRQAAIAAAAVVCLLLFGSCLIEEWSSLPSQMVHLLFLAILLSQIDANSYSIDHTIKKQTV